MDINSQNNVGNNNLLNEFEKLQVEIEGINKYFNQLIEKEQKMRLVLQNQQMLNQKHKYNVDQLAHKPLYAQIIGSSAPEKSSNASQHPKSALDQLHDHPHDQSNTDNRNLVVPPANPRYAGQGQGQHSHQVSQLSNNPQNILPQNQSRVNIQNPSNMNLNEEESKQQQQQQLQQQNALIDGMKQQLQQQEQNNEEVSGMIGNQNQGPQPTFGNDYQSQAEGISYQTQNQQHGGQGYLDQTQRHITNKPSLSQDQMMHYQQQMNQYQMDFNGWSYVNGVFQINDPQQASAMLDLMFANQLGQQVLLQNQSYLKITQEKENQFRQQLQKQCQEIQQKLLRNNNSQELKNTITQKEDEIKRLNQTIMALKEQIKEKSNDIDLWKSKAINLNKTNQNGNTSTLVYDQEIKKLSLVILNQQKEIEDWKTKALNGGIANTLDGNNNLPAASSATGSERIAQQRALLLYIEVERLKNIIQKYKDMPDNNNQFENIEPTFGGAQNNNNNAVNIAASQASKKKSIFTDNNRIFGNQSSANQINSFSRMNNQQNNDDPDIQNLRRLLESKIQEVDEWRMKFAKLAEKAQERDQLEQEVYRLKEALEDTLANNNNNNNGENRVYRSHGGQQDSDKVIMLQNELQKTATALKDKIIENELLRQQQLNLNQSVKNTNVQVQQFSQEAQGKNQLLTGELGKVTNVLKEKLKQNEELRGYMNKLEQMIKDKQYENQQIVQRMQQMQAQMPDKQQFANKVQQYETTIHQMRDDFSKLQTLIKDKTKENETLKSNLQRVQSVQNQRETIESEMRRFQQALELKVRECEEWKLRCKQIEQKLQQASQIEARAKDSEYKLRNLIQEIALLPQKIGKY